MYFLSINRMKKGTSPEVMKKAVPLHIEWTKKMIDKGTFVQAGKWGDIGGMAVIREENIEKAEKALCEDPLIEAGAVSYEIDLFFPDVEIP